MPQLSLFEPRETVLVDDERGRIAYTPLFVPAATARTWFDDLRPRVPWKAERRRMYDRDVDVPRLTAHYPLGPSLPAPRAVEPAAPDTLPPEPSDGLPPAIAAAAREVIARTAVPFNSVGLNLYRSGQDSVAPHNDHLHILVEGFPIALLSLGATRRMSIRAKPPERRGWNLDLEEGSLLVMSYETQLHYTHAVPKTKQPVGERISLAFRVMPEGRPEADDPYR
jgi:alkylated DNA repair dioxygenase AlkB